MRSKGSIYLLTVFVFFFLNRHFGVDVECCSIELGMEAGDDFAEFEPVATLKRN